MTTVCEEHVRLDDVEFREGKDIATEAMGTPLVTFHGRDESDQLLVVSMRRTDFDDLVRRHEEDLQMSLDEAVLSVGLTVLKQVCQPVDSAGAIGTR